MRWRVAWGGLVLIALTYALLLGVLGIARALPRAPQIAYVAAISGGGRVMLMDVRHGVSRPLTPTTTAAMPASLAWSPSGNLLIFEGFVSNNVNLFLLHVDDAPPRVPAEAQQLTFITNDEVAVRWRPTVPDQPPMVLYASARSNNTDLFLLEVPPPGENRRARRLTTNPGMDYSAAWSPDGSRVVFTSVREANFDLYLLDITAGVERRLTDHEASDSGHAWSPDGRFIVFSSLRDGSDDLYLLDLAQPGFPVRRLTNDPWDEFLSFWSPDGRYVAFVSNRDRDPGIHVLDMQRSGADGLPLMLRITSRILGIDGNLAWSPDGRFIAFSAYYQYRQPDVYLVAFRPGHPTPRRRRLTRSPVGEFGIAWRPGS